jgi:hypothetical protein
MDNKAFSDNGVGIFDFQIKDKRLTGGIIHSKNLPMNQTVAFPLSDEVSGLKITNLPEPPLSQTDRVVFNG